MPAFSLPQALHRPRHASFLYPDARHYLPGSLHVSGAPRCARPSGYRGRLRSAFLFSPRPLLSCGAPLLHGSMTDCLIAGENRAGLLLFSCSPPLPARFFPAPRRAALPPGQPPRLLYPVPAHVRLIALFFHISRTLLSALLLVGYIPSWDNTFDRARPPQHPRSGILYTFLAGLIT